MWTFATCLVNTREYLQDDAPPQVISWFVKRYIPHTP